MSMKQFASLSPTYVPELRRAFWARMFGDGIQVSRERAGLSIEEAARSAGMETSEWDAIEAGHVPLELNRLHAMADAMSIRYDMLANLAALCREAWEL